MDSSIRVLHVDDQPDLPELAKTFLEREEPRFDVVTATRPEQAEEAIEQNNLDCVVSDYDMPGKNGLELLRSVREANNDIPFILFTGKGSEEVASDAISAGVTEYLQKGVDSSQYTVLANRIRNAVEKHQAEQEAAETRETLELIAEKSDDILYMFTGDWSELIFINSAYERIYGGSIEELRANPESFLRQIHPDDQEKARESMKKLSSGEPDEIEYRVTLPDGEERVIHGESEPIRDEDGEVSRIVGFVRDITEYI